MWENENTYTGSMLFTCKPFILSHFPGKPGECAVQRHASGQLSCSRTPVRQRGSAPSLDALRSQGDKRAVFGHSPRIFRLFSGTGAVAVRRMMKPVKAGWCCMHKEIVAPTAPALSPVCSSGLLGHHCWLSLKRLMSTSCIMRLDFTLKQMARIS